MSTGLFTANIDFHSLLGWRMVPLNGLPRDPRQGSCFNPLECMPGMAEEVRPPTGPRAAVQPLVLYISQSIHFLSCQSVRLSLAL